MGKTTYQPVQDFFHQQYVLVFDSMRAGSMPDTFDPTSCLAQFDILQALAWQKAQWWGFGITFIGNQWNCPWNQVIFACYSPRKLTWLAGKSTMNEDVFPIINGDFPACHVSFRGVIHGNLIQPLPFTCGRNNMSPARCESDFWVVKRKDCTGFVGSFQAWQILRHGRGSKSLKASKISKIPNVRCIRHWMW